MIYHRRQKRARHGPGFYAAFHNVPFGYKNPCEAASEVAASISAIQQDLGADSQICAVIPGPTSTVPRSGYIVLYRMLYSGNGVT